MWKPTTTKPRAVVATLVCVALLLTASEAQILGLPLPGLGTILGSLGIPCNLLGGVQSVIQLAGGLTMAVTPSAPCQLTVVPVTNYAQAAGPLPAGCQGLQFNGGGNAYGYQVQQSYPQNADLNQAALYTPPVQNPGAITPATPVQCVTPVGSGYSVVPGAQYNSNTGSVAVPVAPDACQSTGSATYIPVAMDNTVPSQMGYPTPIVGNSPQTINYGSGAQQVDFQFQTPEENTVTCTQTPAPYGEAAAPSASVGSGCHVGQYTQFAHQPCTSRSTIRTRYTQQQLDNAGVCDKKRLRLATYDKASKKFKCQSSGYSVDTDNGYVQQQVQTYSDTTPQCALVEQPYNLGETAYVSKAQKCKVAHTAGSEFHGYTSGASQITMTHVPSPSYASNGASSSLPSGYTPLAFQGYGSNNAGAGCGYQVQSSGSAVSQSQVYSAPVTPACAQQVQNAYNNGGRVECLHYNSAGQYQGSLGAANYNKQTGCVSSPVPSCKGDRYVFASKY